MSGLQIAVFLRCPLIAGGAKELHEVSFMRALVPFTRTPFSWPNHLPNTSPPKHTRLEIRSLHMNSGDTNIQSAAVPWCISQKPLTAFVSWTVTHVCLCLLRKADGFHLYSKSLEQSLGHLEDIQKFDEWITTTIQLCFSWFCPPISTSFISLYDQLKQEKCVLIYYLYIWVCVINRPYSNHLTVLTP